MERQADRNCGSDDQPTDRTHAVTEAAAAGVSDSDRRKARLMATRRLIAAQADPVLRRIEAGLRRPDGTQARRALAALLQERPDEPLALKLAGDAKMIDRDFVAAERSYRSAVALVPSFAEARHGLALALFRQAKLDEAAKVADRLLLDCPTDPRVRNLNAACAASLGRHELAINLYRGLAAESEDQPGLWLALGHSFRTIGRTEDAVTAYRRALSSKNPALEGYWALANLKTYRFTEQDVLDMQDKLAAGRSVTDQVFLNFALGKAYEDFGQAAEAFAHYRRGNELQAPRCAEAAKAQFNAIRNSLRWLAAQRSISQPDGGPDGAAEPILVVGLPRSGTTLVEHILSAHSEVEGLSELPYVERIAARRGWLTPAPAVETLLPDGEDRAAAGAEYVRAANAHRTTTRPRWVDKAPVNLSYVPLILAIMPRARIVIVRKQAEAARFSLYKQLFAGSAAYSYRLQDIAEYQRLADGLTDELAARFPQSVALLEYEELVAAFEERVGDLLDFCGLPLEQGCLRFADTRRPIATPSSEQVRSGLNTDGLHSWLPYKSLMDAELSAAQGKD